jgi:hypothetical protein
MPGWPAGCEAVQIAPHFGVTLPPLQHLDVPNEIGAGHEDTLPSDTA